jgi:hypothetical protein
MEVGDPRRYTVEPLEDPVPRERPAEAPDSPLEAEPDKVTSSDARS